MRTQFKFTLRLICTPEYKYTPEYIYTCVFFAHANWTLVVTLANACHVIISNLRVTALTLNTFAQTLISLAHAHSINKNIISCILTQHNQKKHGQWHQNKFVIAQVMKKYDKTDVLSFMSHVKQ